MSNVFSIFAVSDATGELANNVAVAASRQFENLKIKIYRRPRVRTEQKIKDVVAEAKSRHGVIVFTMVSQQLRRQVLSIAQAEGVVIMDVMGPVLDALAHYLHTLPSDEPGLQYKATQDYFKRTEAIEFTVQHDDAMHLESIAEADIVLLGISRASKTPLSIFLAYQGYRCANIPIMTDVPLPETLFTLDRKKMVGLVIAPDPLSEMRGTRLKKLGRSDAEQYAQPDFIQKELEYAKEQFAKLEGMLVVDVTGKAIEEIASEIIHTLGL